MCNNYCGFGVKFGAGKDIACKHCPLNELPKWVPVVEDTPRLTNKKRAMSYSDKVLICLEDGYIDVGYFKFTDRFEWCNEFSCRYRKEVIAWMPLPEPYVEPTDEPFASELRG